MRSRLALLGLFTAVAVSAGSLVSAAPAAAQDDWDFLQRPTSPVIRDAGVYAEHPDGWNCHLFDPCRTDGTRLPTDPPPIAELRRGERVELVCVFGAYNKITAVDGTLIGYIPSEDLAAPLTRSSDTCSIPQLQNFWT